VTDKNVGDAWCFIGMERHTKLILAWHLGQRNMDNTIAFTENLARATEGNFQINTDGFPAYKDAIVYSLGAQFVDFAQVIKIYRNNPTMRRAILLARASVVKRKRPSVIQI